MNRSLFIVCLSLFVGCSEVERTKIEPKMIWGDWQSHSLRLTMNSFENKDSTVYFEVGEREWESKMNMHPILYVYNKDGSYHSYVRDLEGSMERGAAGKWEIIGDSLVLRDTFPSLLKPFYYKLEFSGKQMRMRGKEDADNDGKIDDDHFSVLSRLK